MIYVIPTIMPDGRAQAGFFATPDNTITIYIGVPEDVESYQVVNIPIAELEKVVELLRSDIDNG